MTTRSKFAGQLVRRSGEQIAPITGWLTNDPAGRTWHGTLDAGSFDIWALFHDQNDSLAVELDGKRGDVILTRMTAGSNAATFQGSGPPPL